ncbi:MAG: PASTA domain-containing protein [Sphingobacteriaceae bacterium]|nr:PASTA domain-containing protein [Sphingobacteriaceae bacterium]
MNNFLAYLKTKSFRINILSIFAVLFVLLLITFFSLRYYTKHGQGLNVPKLKGMQLSKATDLLDELGLSYKFDSVYVADKPPGVVIEQDPDYDTFVKDNRTIYLTINTSKAPKISFPDIVNKPFREAQSIIESFGLKVGDTTYAAGIKKDFILNAIFNGEIISKGRNIYKGSTIDLILANGNGVEEVEVPNLIGLTKEEAIFSIKGASLSLGTITYEGNITDSTNTYIIEQTPYVTDSLTKVKVGTAINIILSQKKLD